MVGPPPHLPTPYSHQVAQAVATPINKTHTQANGSRPALQQAAVSKDELILECLIPDDCQFKDTPVSKLISSFKEGQLAPHGQVIACMKILRLLGERGDTLESLESHQITLDMLKSTGIVLSQSAAQPKLGTSTPGPQIDKSFAANRVNTLLTNGVSSHDLTTNKDAVRKTLKQLSQCGPNTIVALVNFGGYVQASDAVVGLSELLELLEICYEPDSSATANGYRAIETGQPTINKACIVESKSIQCPNLGCSFKHRCDYDNATAEDLKSLLRQLQMLYPNPRSFVRVRIDGMVKHMQENAATSSQILCQARRIYRSGWEDKAVDADPPQSSAVEARMEESEEEIVEDSNFSLRNTLFFEDLEHFLTTKSVKFNGMFSTYLTVDNIPHTVAFEVFSALVVEVKEKGGASETFTSLGRLLSQNCDLLIVWKLYYALSLFYNIPASKALIEKAFLKFPHSSLLHLLIYLAHPSISDKALILQLTMQNAAGKRHASSTILNGLINLLAVLDSTRTSPAAIVGHYACLLIHPNPPSGLKRLLTADPTNFPSELPIQTSFVSDKLEGEDFVFCWLVFIYYLGFHGLPPIFASAPFSSCVRPSLFLIKWDQAPKDCVKEHLAPLLRVFSELTKQWPILQGRSLNGLIALLRTYVGFACSFAPHKLPEIEKILMEISTTYISLAEIHELLFLVMQAQSKSVAKKFWSTALAQTKSAGLANFYISITRGKPQLPTALNIAARYLAANDSPCYFSWIIRAKLALESFASHRVLENLHDLFKRSFATFSDPHVLELLHLDYLRCIYHVHPTNGYLVALGLLDETLVDSPACYIPIELGSVAEKGIAKAHDFSLVEKTLELVASWSDSKHVASEIFKSGCVSFPGSFYLAQRLCDIESEDMYQVATDFITHFPADRLAWNAILKHGLADAAVSPSLDDLLSRNKASFSVSPHLLTLSLFP
ncbi:hypothetical protein DSO57_1018109 [Entomophthora muscae]|uniref:Uncharacterized protein n=1 Tax=Entomophthora muscae TaxID=34485 RepID=A0ACC2SH42_9FUNG|nr:hypothetical protein DSO57_1018109 [Entomophthora muscae]